MKFVCTDCLTLAASMWCYKLGRQRQSPPWRLPNCNEPLHWISLRTVGYLRSYIKHSIISVSCSLQIPGRWFKTLNCASIFQFTSWCLDISSSVFAVNSARKSSIVADHIVFNREVDNKPTFLAGFCCNRHLYLMKEFRQLSIKQFYNLLMKVGLR